MGQSAVNVNTPGQDVCLPNAEDRQTPSEKAAPLLGFTVPRLHSRMLNQDFSGWCP